MKIRSAVQGLEIDAYILPPYDEHMNIEIGEHDRRVQYLTGFTGTGAFAVVTARTAAFWVDNRFVQQADAEIDCEWELYRMNDSVTITTWLSVRADISTFGLFCTIINPFHRLNYTQINVSVSIRIMCHIICGCVGSAS